MKLTKYFSKFELGLWSSSILLITLFYFINDLYGFISWKRMERRQKS